MTRHNGHTLVALVVLAGLALASLPITPRVRAQGPINNAMQTIVAATVEAQQTTNAQAAQAASQRATSAALSLQMQQAAATATRAALDQAAADAQATRAAESAQATETAIARATALALQAQTTATEQARRVMAQQAQDAQATADAQATSAEVARAANANATSEQIHADATRTAIALATQTAQRDALFQTLFSAGVVVVLWLLAGMLLVSLVRRLRRAKPRPVVEIVDEPALPGAMPGGPSFTAEMGAVPQSFVVDDLGASHTIVLPDSPETQALVRRIAQEMGDDIDGTIPDETRVVDVEPKPTHSTE